MRPGPTGQDRRRLDRQSAAGQTSDRRPRQGYRHRAGRRVSDTNRGRHRSGRHDRRERRLSPTWSRASGGVRHRQAEPVRTRSPPTARNVRGRPVGRPAPTTRPGRPPFSWAAPARRRTPPARDDHACPETASDDHGFRAPSHVLTTNEPPPVCRRRRSRRRTTCAYAPAPGGDVGRDNADRWRAVVHRRPGTKRPCRRSRVPARFRAEMRSRLKLRWPTRATSLSPPYRLKTSTARLPRSPRPQRPPHAKWASSGVPGQRIPAQCRQYTLATLTPASSPPTASNSSKLSFAPAAGSKLRFHRRASSGNTSMKPKTATTPGTAPDGFSEQDRLERVR